MIEQAKSSTAAHLPCRLDRLRNLPFWIAPESPDSKGNNRAAHPQRVSAVATADGSAGTLARAGRRIGADFVNTVTLAGDVDAMTTNGRFELHRGAAYSAIERDAITGSWSHAGVLSA